MRLHRPCIVCGTPVVGPGRGGARCGRHVLARIQLGPRAYDQKAWRRASKQARIEQPFCSSCGATGDLTADHVVPIAKGGDHVPDPAMIVVLCRRCNGRKGARPFVNARSMGKN
jgi:5-methylcytosine-specific restriction endonuclease McrA